MNKQSKGSSALVVVSLLCFLASGIAWFLLAMVFADYEHLAVPVAGILAGIGGLLLILNAVIHPGSIQIPDVKPPEINVPVGGYGRSQTMHTGVNTKVPGIINVNEWPIVSIFKKGGETLTRRQQICGTLCNLLWIATIAVYLPVSFYMDNWEISWVIFLGAAVVHTLLYGLLSIGQKK